MEILVTTEHRFSLEEVECILRDAMDKAADDIHSVEEGLENPVVNIQFFASCMKGKRMLDVGCGWGRYAQCFVDLGLIYTGIDLSPRMIEIAQRSNLGLIFKEMSFRKIDFPDESFEGLWSCCSLGFEPKRNMQAVLREMSRILVPGGLLYIVLPNHWDSFEDPPDPSATGFKRIHYARWLPDEFLDVIRKSGLDCSTRLWVELFFGHHLDIELTLGKGLRRHFENGRKRDTKMLGTLHCFCFYCWVYVKHNLRCHAYSLYIAIIYVKNLLDWEKLFLPISSPSGNTR